MIRLLSIFIMLTGLFQAPQDSVAVAVDSTTVNTAAVDSAAFRLDSIIQQYRAMGLWEPDSLLQFTIDSTFTAEFDSLLKTLPDTTDIRRLIKQQKKEYRDSVRIATPRILSTYAIPDSLKWNRIITWKADTEFNEMQMGKVDSSYNYNFYDYPFFKKDVNANYLGPIGSATQLFNYFKQQSYFGFAPAETYLTYSHTPDDMPQFNTKNPYVELGFWGTPFALRSKEEMELKFLVSQNINPAFNFTINYEKFGSRGMLANEQTDDRNLSVALNYLGKRYVANGGIINQHVTQQENGGVQDTKQITDTLVDPKEIAVYLNSASSKFRRTTFFINHSLAIPMNFFRKNKDSLAVGDGTTAYIGHYGEVSQLKRCYYDKITDKAGREYYHNNFFIDSKSSADSLSMWQIDNKLFIKLQPFAPDAIVSKINGGVGFRYNNYYRFDPEYYISGPKSEGYSNAYVYAGVSGQFRKYFFWNAMADYYFAGYRAGDVTLKANVRLSFYPLEQGLHLNARLHLSNTSPDPLQQKIYFNHHVWSNNFTKYFENRIEADLEIPKWKFKVGAGYSIKTNGLYYDETGMIRQTDHGVNVFSAYLQKDFKLWLFHFDNNLLYQATSDEVVTPLPKFSANLRYYLQFTVVKNAMDMQIGVNGTYYTKYYAPGYMPDLGVFYNQRNEELGNTFYFDPFVNMQWQRVCVFIKYTNAFLGKPSKDRFSCYGHIRPEKFLKFGVLWPF